MSERTTHPEVLARRKRAKRRPTAAHGRHRLIFNLNQDWDFLLPAEASGVDPLVSSDGELPWERVNLPHAACLDPLNASGGRNFQGTCWYRKNLHIEPAWRGKLVYLHFEGAMQVADVWLNGRQLLTHYCGYLPFTVDITSTLSFERDNLLLVSLDNSDNPQVPPGKPQREQDFTYFAGLYRNVRLEVLDRLHITDELLADRVAGGGVFVTCSQVSDEAATMCVKTHVANEHDQARHCVVQQELIDAKGAVVATDSCHRALCAGKDDVFEQSLAVARPKLWHPHYPHLYTLRTIVRDEAADSVVDDRHQRIGIRHIRFDSEHGLFINGEKFLSVGANRHQDHPYVGYALPDSAHRRDVKKLREAGFTSFRSHYPQAPAFMDACDELGMLTIVSNPGWQFMGDELFRRRAIHNARMMVRRDRNRPSVILWEAALNETDNKPLAAALHQAVHEEYPGDPCHTAGDREAGFSWRGQRSWDVDYLHNDGSKPYWIREWGDQVDNWTDQQSASRVARGWGETPMLVQARSHLSRMDELISQRRLCGACLWAGIDCQRGYHHQPFYGGPLDLFRVPKFDYYLFQSQRPPHVHVPGLDDGPMVFIASFATFLSPTNVTIFSNCDQVRLFQNGKEVGTQKPDGGHSVEHPPFTFSVEEFSKQQSTMYMTGVARVGGTFGELRAEGLIGGKVVAMHTVQPPGVACKLVLKADLCNIDLVADGGDWVRVHTQVCDARGTICPFADDQITFVAEGEGSIIGGQEIGANPMRAEAGIATALVRSSARAGKIVVRASAFGLEPAKITIQSVAPPWAALLPAKGTSRRAALAIGRT